MSGEQYDADYFLRGKQTGKSLYENYRWMPELTIPMCQRIVEHCGIERDDTILDFGCARGYVVRALRRMGYYAWGCDTSKWAIDNCDPIVRKYLDMGITAAFDWIIAKDVLEHVVDLADTIDAIMRNARIGVFVVVPLGYGEDGYVVPDYERDVTHIHKLTLATWVGKFLRPGWSVEGRYRVPGVKDNYAQYPTGNGFITARRLSE